MCIECVKEKEVWIVLYINSMHKTAESKRGTVRSTSTAVDVEEGKSAGLDPE